MPSLLGTAPNQVSVNSDLGKLAFMDVVDTVTNNPYIDTAISDTKPSLLLDFANSKTLDPRITYTRASTATYYDGKTTAVAEQNLLTYSQEFDNAAWVVSSGTATKTANSAAAPDGNTTADTLAATSANAVVWQTYVPVAGSSYSGSVYLKRKTGTGTVNFTADGSTYTAIDLSGGGWVRATQTYTATAGTKATGVQITTSGDEVYIWGAQLEQRSAVSSYTPTTSSTITNYIPALQTAAAGVPRFDHDPVTGESKGFLIEEQRTNLVTYSSAFDNAAWTKGNATITADTLVAPDGTLTGDKLICSNGVTGDIRRPSIPSSTGTYTASIYAKAGEYTSFEMWAYSNEDSFTRSTFNLATGTVVSGSGSIKACGNGWYLCSITKTWSGLTNAQVSYAGFLAAGNGYSGIYIWGAQLEAGSFATSYIPTTSAQVTRSADAASMTGANFSSWYNDAYGSMYGEFISANPTSFQITGNTSAYGMDIGVTTTAGFHYNNSSNLYTGNGYLRNSVGKIAFSGDTTGRSLSLNGGAVATSQTSLITGNTQQGLKLGMAFTGLVINGTIKKLAYFPKRLSDAELQEMTL